MVNTVGATEMVLFALPLKNVIFAMLMLVNLKCPIG
jgi:hypothetical protein